MSPVLANYDFRLLPRLGCRVVELWWKAADGTVSSNNAAIRPNPAINSELV